MRQRKNSGQLLVLVALLIALILISSELYVVNVGKSSGINQMSSIQDYGLSLELGSKHVIIGSLANITSGGQNENLLLNLQRWSSFVANEEKFGNHFLFFYPKTSTPYSEGLWISGGSDGIGISSAVVDFDYRVEQQGINWTRSFTVNVTSSVQVYCNYRIINENEKQTSVTFQLSVDGSPAFAKQFSIEYDKNGTWLVPDETNNYLMQNFGNGTYNVVFSNNLNEANSIYVQVTDSNGIMVRAFKNAQPTS